MYVLRLHNSAKNGCFTLTYKKAIKINLSGNIFRKISDGP